MAEHSMQWKLFHEMDESVLQSTNVPTIPKTTSTTRYPDLRLPLTQHGLRICYACAAMWRNRPLLAQIATSGLLIQLELNPLDNPQIADYYADVAHTSLDRYSAALLGGTYSL
jgi:hypothetical protein